MNCPQVYHKTIGSGNGLVPSGNKPLPEAMVFQVYHQMASLGHNELKYLSLVWYKEPLLVLVLSIQIKCYITIFQSYGISFFIQNGTPIYIFKRLSEQVSISSHNPESRFTELQVSLPKPPEPRKWSTGKWNEIFKLSTWWSTILL